MVEWLGREPRLEDVRHGVVGGAEGGVRVIEQAIPGGEGVHQRAAGCVSARPACA